MLVYGPHAKYYLCRKRVSSLKPLAPSNRLSFTTAICFNNCPMVIKAVKGVKDILPGDTAKWRMLEKKARSVFRRFGYREIVLPIFEKSEVFIKGVGETTDIVQKEMYTFADQGNESLTLRPEGTASCVRAYIEHSMYHPQGAVTPLFYFGPMFRRERPQKGRFRQFFQIGAELFGIGEPTADAEVIHLLTLLLKEAGIKEQKLFINSLGCGDCRPEFKKGLVEYLSGKKESLCDNCKERYKANPLRVIDCKSESCAKVIADAPTIDKYWCGDCRTHFTSVRENLKTLGLEFELNLKMVRGLDYYNRTVFEVIGENLGAQNSIAGGGRYDSLVKDSGGPSVPAIGFAIGVERLISSIGDSLKGEDESPDVYIVHQGKDALAQAFKIAGGLRELGIKTACLYKQTSIKKQIANAGKSGAGVCVILGENEISRNIATVKDLSTGEQEECPLSKINDAVKALRIKRWSGKG